MGSWHHRQTPLSTGLANSVYSEVKFYAVKVKLALTTSCTCIVAPQPTFPSRSLSGPRWAQFLVQFWQPTLDPFLFDRWRQSGWKWASMHEKRGQEWANLGTFSSCDTYVCRPFLLFFCLLIYRLPSFIVIYHIPTKMV
jgi:hypothetical protein